MASITKPTNIGDRIGEELEDRLRLIRSRKEQVAQIGDVQRARDDFEYYYRSVFLNVDPVMYPHGAHQDFMVKFITWQGHEGVFPEYKLLVTPPGAGKSNIVAKALASWTVGKEPLSPTCLATSTSPLAANRSLYLREFVAHDPLWKTVFPDPVPYNILWRTDEWALLPQQGARFTSSEPTFRSTGADASIGGIRIKYAIVDDAHNDKNARTNGEREKIKYWYFNQFSARQAGMEGGWMVMLANIWHGDDLTCTLWDSGQFAVMHLQALYNDSEVYVDVTLPRKLGNAGPALADWCGVTRDRWVWKEKERSLRMVVHRNGPSYWPKKITTGELREKEKYPGFKRVWNGNRKEGIGDRYNAEWFRYWNWEKPPSMKSAQMVWDTASEEKDRSDYSACVLQYIGMDGDIYTGDAFNEKLESGTALPLAIACWYYLARLNDIPVRLVLIEESSYARSSIKVLKTGWPRDVFIAMAKRYLSMSDANPSLVRMIRLVIKDEDALPDVIKIPLRGIKVTKRGKDAVHDDALAYYGSGNVWHLEGMSNLRLLETQQEDYPYGDNDDLADAQAHGIVWHFGVRKPRQDANSKTGFAFVDLSSMLSASPGQQRRGQQP